MLYLKACPKCHGDIELVIMPDSKTLSCLQCSFTVDSRDSAIRAMGRIECDNAYNPTFCKPAEGVILERGLVDSLGLPICITHEAGFFKGYVEK